MQEQVKVVSVNEYLEHMNACLFSVFESAQVLIEGEVSDWRVSQQKWISFDLKDQNGEALIKCFATIWSIKTIVENGMRVQVQGIPKVYERYGTLKLTVSHLEPVGEGALKKAYEAMKERLRKEGLFDVSRKRSIPRFPKKIGLITSKDAAAYGDFLRILQNRFCDVDVLHTNVHVQGKEAVSDILNAFSLFQQMSDEEKPDVLVLTRGGGGLEDLHAFNDESVARAVFQSSIPVIVAVGHERDESLCDFVCDVRASTPSNAAERIVPSKEELIYEIERMQEFFIHRFDYAQEKTELLVKKMVSISQNFFDSNMFKIDLKKQQLVRFLDQWFLNMKQQIIQSEKLLKQVDPKQVLNRGYALIRNKKGTAITSAEQVNLHDIIDIQFKDGVLQSEVFQKNGKGKQKFL